MREMNLLQYKAMQIEGCRNTYEINCSPMQKDHSFYFSSFSHFTGCGVKELVEAVEGISMSIIDSSAPRFPLLFETVDSDHMFDL